MSGGSCGGGFNSSGLVILQDGAPDRWLRFRDPIRLIVVRRLEETGPALDAVEEEVELRGRHAAGFVCYEAASAFDSALKTLPPVPELPLLWFGIYERAEPFDFDSEDAESPEATDGASDDVDAPDWEPSVGPAEYDEGIRRVREYLANGHTYQVNYSYRLRSALREPPWDFFRRLIRSQNCAHGAYVHTGDWIVCSASPELFFERRGAGLLSRPMKGTASRRPGAAQDRLQALQLQNSEKNRAENVMIVDMVRNDLGRIARPGSVSVPRLFEVERYPTLWQMASDVRCESGASLRGVFEALFPAASITGAPKARTMEIIRELETAPRGVYTGCVGRVAPGRFARFNVAIRTALIEARGQGAEYGVGGGVVWDSDSRGESRECRVKSRVLTRRQPEFALLETLLWRPEDGFPLIERHLGRLADSAEYFSRKVDLDQIRSLLERTAAGLPARPHRVRLLVHERRPPEAQAAPLEPLPSPWRVRLAARLVNSENVFLWHKTTWRRVYEDALREAPEYNDVLLWNERGECTESLIGNLVAEKDGEWFTPPLEAGLLDGVGRRLLIEQGRLREKTIPKEELTEYDSLRLVNSVRGVWPIELSTDEASSI